MKLLVKRIGDDIGNDLGFPHSVWGATLNPKP